VIFICTKPLALNQILESNPRIYWIILTIFKICRTQRVAISIVERVSRSRPLEMLEVLSPNILPLLLLLSPSPPGNQAWQSQRDQASIIRASCSSLFAVASLVVCFYSFEFSSIQKVRERELLLVNAILVSCSNRALAQVKYWLMTHLCSLSLVLRKYRQDFMGHASGYLFPTRPCNSSSQLVVCGIQRLRYYHSHEEHQKGLRATEPHLVLVSETKAE
jgi:hypothetical protein